jgi:hypothetical protein
VRDAVLDHLGRLYAQIMTDHSAQSLVNEFGPPIEKWVARDPDNPDALEALAWLMRLRLKMRRTLEAKRFVNADPDDMREGWEAHKERQWNAAYCNDDSWREAIDNGWSIISTLSFRTGAQVSFVAEC